MRLRIFEMLGIVAAMAVLFSRCQPDAAAPSRLDWPQLTVEGFGAGTTEQQLVARLGPPTVDQGRRAMWHPERHVFVGFHQDSAGLHLFGSRLSLGDRVIATGQDTGPRISRGKPDQRPL